MNDSAARGPSPDDLATLPPDALDAAWEIALATATDDDRAAWLEAADALREGPTDDKSRARAVYWAVRDSLEPREPADVPRILLILRSGLERDPTFALLATRAVGADDARLRHAAQICVAQCQSVAGYFADAEARLREVLSHVRGTGTRLERTAYASLAVVYHNQGREFEALMLTRIVLRLSKGADDPWEACVAHQQHCAMLDALGDWDAMEAALADLSQALERADPPWAWTMWRYIHGERAEAALERGDLEAARDSVEQMRAVVPEGVDDVAVPQWHPVLAARLALAEGRPAAALELVDDPALRSDGRAELVGVRAHFKTGESERAVERGRRLLDNLAEEREVWGGAAQRLRLSAAVAHAFEDHEAEPADVHRAYDIAAEAAMRRIFELEHTLATLPDLAAVGREEMDTLATHRIRFRERHARLLARLTPHLQSEIGVGGAFAVNEGHLRVCAWCHRIASRASQWLPVGHLLPAQAGVPVTHTICPDCVDSHGFR